jgi:hypothetical protein
MVVKSHQIGKGKKGKVGTKKVWYCVPLVAYELILQASTLLTSCSTVKSTPFKDKPFS